MRLTADVVLRARSFLNTLKERELDIRGYKIPTIENLGTTKDQYDTLDLSDNEVRNFENFPRLHRLKSVYLHNNRVASIEGELNRNIPNIETLMFTNNKLVNLTDLDPLACLAKLTTLSLIGNPVTTRPHYRMYVIYKVPQLKTLDFQKIKLKEREEAARLFKSMTGMQVIEQDESVRNEGKQFIPGQMKTAQEQLSSKQIQQIQMAIANAKTPEEVDRLEQQLKAGVIPSIAPAAGQAPPPPPPAQAAPPPPKPPAPPAPKPPAPPAAPPAPAPAPAPEAMEVEAEVQAPASKKAKAKPKAKPAPAPAPAPEEPEQMEVEEETPAPAPSPKKVVKKKAKPKVTPAKLTVAKLRSALTDLGLETTGLKAVLVKRLEEALEADE
jgi:U2 small nuclear ribonucleoprotein A'